MIITKNRGSHFNEVYGARSYSSKNDSLSKLASFLSRYEVTRADAVLGLIERGQRLLDVGCGDGDFCIRAKKSFDEVYGIDVSSVRINNARQKTSDFPSSSFTFIDHDIDEGLPFSDNFFDCVTCMASLECSVYPPFVIKEIKRLLKPNGVFVVTVGNIAFLPRRFSLLVGKAPVIFGLDDKGFEWDRLHSFTCKGISELVKNEGLDVEILSCSGVFAKRRKIWISLLSGDVIIKARKKSV